MSMRRRFLSIGRMRTHTTLTSFPVCLRSVDAEILRCPPVPFKTVKGRSLLGQIPAVDTRQRTRNNSVRTTNACEGATGNPTNVCV